MGHILSASSKASFLCHLSSELPLSFRSKYSRGEDQQLQSSPYDSLLGDDQPSDNWDRADRLRREDKSKRKLLLAYEKILLSELDNSVSPTASVESNFQI